jgi:hypothetical protein
VLQTEISSHFFEIKYYIGSNNNGNCLGKFQKKEKNMKTFKLIIAIIGMLVLSNAALARVRTIRAIDMGNSMWSDLARGKLGDIIVEFRQGDELPVNFEAQGDLLETKQPSISYVTVKKNFWLRLSQNEVEISFDGNEFKKLNESVTGSIEAGAGSAVNGGVADAINIVFKAFLK